MTAATALLLLLAAPPTSVQLRYVLGEQTEACPAGETLRARVAARLGYNPFEQDGELFITATIEGSGGAFTGTLTTNAGAERVLAAADCDELAQAMELAIAVAIDPLASMQPPAETTPPPPPPVPTKTTTVSAARTTTVAAMPPPPPPVPKRRVEATTGYKRQYGFRFGGGVAGLLGTSPKATMGFVAMGGMTLLDLDIELEVRLELPTSTPASGGRVRAQLFSVTALPGYYFGDFLLAGRVSVGATLGQGEGLVAERSTTSPYVGIGLRAAYDLPLLSRLLLRFYLEGEGVLVRTTLRVGDVAAWRSPPFWGGIGIGLVGDFR